MPEAGALTPSRFVDYLLDDADDINVVVGPLVWRPSDGTSARRWYFIGATSAAGTLATRTVVLI